MLLYPFGFFADRLNIWEETQTQIFFFNKLLFKILNFDKYLCTEELDAKIKGHKFTVTQVPNKISNSVRCLLLMTTFWSMVKTFTLNIYQLLVKIIITDRLNHEEVKTQILEGWSLREV